MPEPGWLLIAEQEERWTAAVAARLRRQAGPRPLLRRVETPPPANAFAARAAVFVAVELRRDNVVRALGQLRDLRRHPSIGAAALISPADIADPYARDELSLAALEAGACLAVDSLRRLGPLLTVARRSLAAAMAEFDQQSTVDDAAWPTGRVWRRLPWQAEPWPVG